MGCRMSLKIYILDAPLDKFKENIAAYLGEHGKHFYQDLVDLKDLYKQQWKGNMMEDNLRGLICESYCKFPNLKKTTNFYNFCNHFV